MIQMKAVLCIAVVLVTASSVFGIDIEGTTVVVPVAMHAAAAVPIYGYASVVRDGTGDAIFIFGTSPNN